MKNSFRGNTFNIQLGASHARPLALSARQSLTVRRLLWWALEGASADFNFALGPVDFHISGKVRSDASAAGYERSAYR